MSKEALRFIDVLTDFRSHGQQFYKGEHVKLPDDQGREFIANGWASDPTGELKTGVSSANDVVIEVHDGAHANSGSSPS